MPGMMAVAPNEVEPSVAALLILPMVDGADPLLSAIQYRVLSVKSLGDVCALLK